jgi:ABC-type methionine transport system ATPase subunit
MTEAFTANDITFSFAEAPLLKGISLSVAAGGAVAIAGRSGCGKSTLLELCAGLRTPASGSVTWDGVDIARLTHEGLMKARRNIGYVFQKHALIHNFTIYDNIALPLRYHRHLGERDERAAVKGCMEKLGLFDVDRKFPNELSAAQSRCAAIARAVIMGPRIVFLDEPTAGVDPVTAGTIATVLVELNASRGTAVVMICNNPEILKMMQCPVMVLDNGALYDYRDPARGHSGHDMFSALRNAL